MCTLFSRESTFPWTNIFCPHPWQQCHHRGRERRPWQGQSGERYCQNLGKTSQKTSHV